MLLCSYENRGVLQELSYRGLPFVIYFPDAFDFTLLISHILTLAIQVHSRPCLIVHPIRLLLLRGDDHLLLRPSLTFTALFLMVYQEHN